MSLSIYVFENREKNPSPEQWVEAVRSCGFELSFEPPFDANTADGYCPCRMGEIEAGFEICAGPSGEVAAAYKDARINELAAQYDTVLEFLYAADEEELAVASASAAVLAVATGGVIYDPADDRIYRGDEALAHAIEVIDSLHLDK